jgi:hypothetical protein
VDSHQTVFIARVIRTGHTAQVSGKWVGDWGIGLVQERFWGLRSWMPRIVLLTNNVFQEGQSYFIDGRRSYLLLPQFLPIVEADFCTRTRRVEDATIELRLLREAPGPEEMRIIGIVQLALHPRELKRSRQPTQWKGLSAAEIQAAQMQQVVESVVNPPAKYARLAHAKVRLTGLSGSALVTADQGGIYEVAGLPPGDYTPELLDVPLSRRAFSSTVKKSDLILHKFVRADIYVQWDGILAGTIRDSAGGPAHVWLEIETADGMLTGDFTATRQTNEKGAFQFENLPPRRYRLKINPDGPTKDSPYSSVYFPLAVRPDDARVFEIGEGQHIQNVDVNLPRLKILN